jgi:hypothetical protein
MRVRTLGVPCLPLGLILLWLGCGAEPPPAPQVCPKKVLDLPDRPEAERLSAGKECFLDSDCRSGFCDRGRCGDVYSWGNYGRECVPGPSPPPEKPDPRSPDYPRVEFHLTPFGRNLCTGYLCLNGRCQSCKEDAECQWEGSAGPKCLEYFEWFGKWPGKRCGTPVEPRTPTIGHSPAPVPPPPAPPPAPTGSAPPPKP